MEGNRSILGELVQSILNDGDKSSDRHQALRESLEAELKKPSSERKGDLVEYYRYLEKEYTKERTQNLKARSEIVKEIALIYAALGGVNGTRADAVNVLKEKMMSLLEREQELKTTDASAENVVKKKRKSKAASKGDAQPTEDAPKEGAEEQTAEAAEAVDAQDQDHGKDGKGSGKKRKSNKKDSAKVDTPNVEDVPPTAEGAEATAAAGNAETGEGTGDQAAKPAEEGSSKKRKSSKKRQRGEDAEEAEAPSAKA